MRDTLILDPNLKTSDEILQAIFKYRHDLQLDDVYDIDRYTIKLTQYQLDELKNLNVRLFNYQDNLPEARLAGFILEIVNE